MFLLGQSRSKLGLRLACAIANLAGIVAFLRLASVTWIEPELKDFPGASGGAAIVWGLTALPVFLAFTLANLIWSAIEIRGALKTHDWRPLLFSVLTLAAWIVAFVFDGVHHGA